MKLKPEKLTNRIVSILLVLSLLFSSGVYAMDNETQNTNAELNYDFPDVPVNHWARKYISKLALLGVVNGDSKGQYNPGKDISRQEVITMAIKLMGLNDEVNTAVDVGLPFEVSSWAKPFVVLALDKGILNLQEELSALVSGTLTNAWGSQPATREWVAKIAVRAAGLQSLAQELSDQPSSFTDHASISVNALGYINAAVRLNIVSGFSDGSFKPLDPVNRGQVAAFFSNAENHLVSRSDRIASGTVLAVADNRLSIRDNAGTVRTFTMDERILVYESGQMNLLSLADIKPHSSILLIQSQEKAYFAEIGSIQEQLEKITGQLMNKSIEEMKITLSIDGSTREFDLAANVSVIGKDGSGTSLGALPILSTVEITRSGNPAGEIVLINIKELPLNRSGLGTIHAIGESSLTVKDDGSKDSATYPLAADISLIHGSAALNSISELQMEDSIEYEVQDGQVVSIRLLKLALRSIAGTLDELDAARKRVVIRNSAGTLELFELASSYKIMISGMLSPILTDLMTGDILSLSVNDENKIESISVQNREIEEGILTSIIYYDSASKKLWTRDNTGADAIMQISDKTTFVTDSGQANADHFSIYYPNGKKVMLTFSNQQILSIEQANKFNGTIMKISTGANVDQRSITVMTDKNRLLSFPVDSNASVEIYDNSSGSFKDLAEGDSVRVVLNSSQEKVAQILVERSVWYRVAKTDSSKRTLTLKDFAGVSGTLLVQANIPITISDGSTKRFDDIPTDEPILVNYLGKTVTGVEISPAIRGQVISLNAGNAMEIKDAHNSVHSVLTNVNTTVYKNGVKSTVSMIAIHDRIEVMTGAQGSVYVIVIPAEEKKFWQYNASKQEVSFKRNTLSEKYSFKLHKNSYIHQGDQLISPVDLRDFDKVTVYILDDKIIEIEKK